MKKFYFLLILAIVFINNNVKAQESLLNFSEDIILVNGESINVGITTLKGNEKDIKKQWNAYVKEHIDAKMKEDDGLLMVKKVVIEQISNKRGDLLTYIFTKDNVVSLNVSHRLGYDIFINSTEYASEFEGLKAFVNDFVYNYYIVYLPEQIEATESELKDVVKENKKAQKLIEKTRKDNANNRKKIIKTQKSIQSVENELASETDLEAKKKFTTEKAALYDEIKKLEAEILANDEIIKSNEEEITKLAPKIEELTNEIKAIDLLLEEVKIVMDAK